MTKIQRVALSASTLGLLALPAPYASAAKAVTPPKQLTAVPDGRVAIKASGKTVKVPAYWLEPTSKELDNGYWSEPPMPKQTLQIKPSISFPGMSTSFAKTLVVYDFAGFIFISYRLMPPAYAAETKSGDLTVAFTNEPFSTEYMDGVQVILVYRVPGSNNATATDAIPVPKGSGTVTRSSDEASWGGINGNTHTVIEGATFRTPGYPSTGKYQYMFESVEFLFKGSATMPATYWDFIVSLWQAAQASPPLVGTY